MRTNPPPPRTARPDDRMLATCRGGARGGPRCSSRRPSRPRDNPPPLARAACLGHHADVGDAVRPSRGRRPRVGPDPARPILERPVGRITRIPRPTSPRRPPVVRERWHATRTSTHPGPPRTPAARPDRRSALGRTRLDERHLQCVRVRHPREGERRLLALALGADGDDPADFSSPKRIFSERMSSISRWIVRRSGRARARFLALLREQLLGVLRELDAHVLVLQADVELAISRSTIATISSRISCGKTMVSSTR